jgi:hypothetical protein
LVTSALYRRRALLLARDRRVAGFQAASVPVRMQVFSGLACVFRANPARSLPKKGL